MFTHEILKSNCTYKEARDLESYLIKKYDTVDNGYNNSCFLLGERFKFDFNDFNPIDNDVLSYQNTNTYFTRVPNFFIQKNLQKEYGLNRVFLIVFILIDRHRSYEDTSYITIGEVLNVCGYKDSRHKPKIFYEVIKSLLFLIESNFIEAKFDIYGIGYSDCIHINIITQNFDYDENFTKIYGKDFDSIMEIKSKTTKESILMAFLYIDSYIYIRPRDKDDNEIMFNPETKPEAFWRSIDGMAKELSMSKDTITQCIHCLTTPSGENEPLLIKREVGSIQPDPKKPPKNVPNIYVLNKEGYQQEIEWALCKMLEVYGVDNFDLPKSGNKSKTSN